MTQSPRSVTSDFSISGYMDEYGTGRTNVFKLIRTGELESYLDGNRRKITRESAERRRQRLLEADRQRRGLTPPADIPPEDTTHSTTAASLEGLALKCPGCGHPIQLQAVPNSPQRPCTATATSAASKKATNHG